MMEPDGPIAIYPVPGDPSTAAANNAFGPPGYNQGTNNAFGPPGYNQGANNAFGPPAYDPATNSAFGPLSANSAFGPQGSPPPAYFAPEQPHPSTGGSKQGWKTWVAGATAAVVFGLGGFFGIQAVAGHSKATATSTNGGGIGNGAPGGGRGFGGPRGGTFGTIKSISGSTLTITTQRGSTETVTTSSSTTVTNSTSGSVSDIKVGDHVVALAGFNSSSSGTADRIVDSGTSSATAAGPGQGRGGPLGGNAVSGTVASVGNGSFTVTEATGTTATVKTSSSTDVTLMQPSSVSALTVGESVRIAGTTTNGTLAATSIDSGDAGFGPGAGGGPGGGFGPGGGQGGPPAA